MSSHEFFLSFQSAVGRARVVVAAARSTTLVKRIAKDGLCVDVKVVDVAKGC